MRLSRLFLLLTLAVSTLTLLAADKQTAPQLIALAQTHSAALPEAINATFTAKELQEGTAWTGQGHDFFFALRAATPPQLFLDGAPGPQMENTNGLWYSIAHIEKLGALHAFNYQLDRARFGGDLNLPAFGPDSYPQPSAPQGKLSDKLIHTSKIYDGMQSEYWVYVPAGYNPQVPAALMVFQDGGGYIHREGNNPALNVIDNLIAQKKIPMMICVFINPGDVSGAPGTPTYRFVEAYSNQWRRTLKDSLRSTEYDTVSDRYVRFLRDELLPQVAAHYNLRQDAYSRAITGLSSGGICSFNAAWQMPDQFSRVLTWIGSFTSIQWKQDAAIPDGGQDYPEKILREPVHNLRVWLQDGGNDQENDRYGSWPLANIRMANALKLKNYDFHFSFGQGTHNSGHGAAEFPQEMTWLWRDYDSSHVAQTYEMEPAEKARPLFRVALAGRDPQ